MTEAELIRAAKEIAELIGEKVDEFTTVQYIDEGDLEGEPASIVVMFEDGRQFALGVLPI